MKRVSLLLISLITAELFFMASVGSTNDEPIWIMGGGAAPKSSHPSIRMDSEVVIIRLGRDVYTVDAVFHFFNTSAPPPTHRNILNANSYEMEYSGRPLTPAL